MVVFEKKTILQQEMVIRTIRTFLPSIAKIRIIFVKFFDNIKTQNLHLHGIK